MNVLFVKNVFTDYIFSIALVVESYLKKYHYLGNNLEKQYDSKAKQLDNQGIEPNHQE